MSVIKEWGIPMEIMDQRINVISEPRKVWYVLEGGGVHKYVNQPSMYWSVTRETYTVPQNLTSK